VSNLFSAVVSWRYKVFGGPEALQCIAQTKKWVVLFNAFG